MQLHFPVKHSVTNMFLIIFPCFSNRFLIPFNICSPPVRSADTSESTTLFIGNLSYNIGERELFDIMDRVGRVRNVTIGWNQRTNQSRGYAFVQFADRRAAEAAYDHFKYYNLDGRPLRVDWDEGLDKKAPARPNDRGGDRRRDDRYGRRSRSPRRDRRSRSPRTLPVDVPCNCTAVLTHFIGYSSPQKQKPPR